MCSRYSLTSPPEAVRSYFRTVNGLVRVPAGAAQLVVRLAAEGQLTADDRAWFAEAKVVRM